MIIAVRFFAAIIIIFCLCGGAWAETLITKAKIAEVTERGFILTIGTEAVAVQDESASHFWKDRKPAGKSDFAAGASVTVRLKTDAAPTVVREMADTATYDWLEKIRKDVVACTVVKVDPKVMTVKIDGGGEFAYRYSDKSKVTVADASGVTDLKEGQKLFVKGRLLPSLDTWIVSASDTKPLETPKTKTSKPKETKTVIGPSGTIRGTVDLHRTTYLMIDLMVEGRLIHTVYNAKTQFKLDGQKADPSAIQRGQKIEVTYKRDQFGRLIASKVELFRPGTA
jgi:hypothetical protein